MNVKEIASVFQKELGLSSKATAGMLGSTFGESSHSFSAYNPNDPNGGSFGFAQWNGPRKKALDKFAKENGYSDWTDPKAQVGFMINELKTTEKKTLAALRSAKTAEEAAVVWTNLYERPAKNEESMQKRVKKATEFASLLSGGSGEDSLLGGTDLVADSGYALGSDNPYAALLNFDLGSGVAGSTEKKKMTPKQAIAAAVMNMQFGEEALPFALAHVGTHAGDPGAELTAAEGILGGLGGYFGGIPGALVGEAIGGLFNGSKQTQKVNTKPAAKPVTKTTAKPAAKK